MAEKKLTIEEQKIERLKSMTDFDSMEYNEESGTEEEWCALVAEGLGLEWPVAMEIYAYATYTGTKQYAQNFSSSEKMLLKLIEKSADPSPFWFNTLGYIYYYGRTTGGTPDYEKAQKYFTVAAMFGVFEAEYKLCDMMLKGKGLPKSIKTAARTLDRLYGETREQFEHEQFDCKFADVALRVGNMYATGTGFDRDPENALSLLLQANFAIDKRMEYLKYYGDEKVKKSITESLEKARAQMPKDYFKTCLDFNHPVLIGALLQASNGIDVMIIEKDGSDYIIAKRVPKDEQDEKKYLFCVPEIDTCALADSAVMKIEGLRDLEFHTQENHFFVNHIELDEKRKIWKFCYLDQPLVTFRAKGFSLEK